MPVTIRAAKIPMAATPIKSIKPSTACGTVTAIIFNLSVFGKIRIAFSILDESITILPGKAFYFSLNPPQKLC